MPNLLATVSPASADSNMAIEPIEHLLLVTLW